MTTYSGVPGDSKCECADHGCPTKHGGNDGNCCELATCILYRVDMADVTGTAFCDACAEDAMESGVFTDSTEDETSVPHNKDAEEFVAQENQESSPSAPSLDSPEHIARLKQAGFLRDC